jgi:hypothetical protein
VSLRELPHDVTVQRPHDADARHGRAVAIDDQEHRFDRTLPFLELLLGLRELLDIFCGVLKGDKLATARQRDRIIERPFPALGALREEISALLRERKISAGRMHGHIAAERERIFYGLDSRLFPGTRTVDVTQITPAPGSFALTYVEIKTVTGQVPEYLYLAGNVRFRISGMVLKSSNFPAGLGMAPQQ